MYKIAAAIVMIDIKSLACYSEITIWIVAACRKTHLLWGWETINNFFRFFV